MARLRRLDFDDSTVSMDFDDSTDLIDFDDSTDSAIRLNIGNFNSDCGHWTARMRRHDFGDPTDLTDFDDTTLTT